MHRIKKRVVTPFERKSLYVISAFLWLTGILWLYLRYAGQIQSEFGPQHHPAQSLVLKIHGAAAMVFLVVLGLLIHHMRLGWRRNQERFSGMSLVVSCGFLILTGWALYYVGEEHLRNLASLSHSVLGILLPMIIFVHVYKARAQQK